MSFQIDQLMKFSKLKQVVSLIDEFLTLHVESIDLWKFKLMLSIDEEKPKDEIEEIFKKSLESVKEKVKKKRLFLIYTHA